MMYIYCPGLLTLELKCVEFAEKIDTNKVRLLHFYF
jgi:hypothetical protein